MAPGDHDGFLGLCGSLGPDRRGHEVRGEGRQWPPAPSWDAESRV